jgi:DNA polymerase III epsilon subunit-like protein
MLTFIGIDGEMSGNNIDAGHKLIQIGLAKIENNEMKSIGYMINPGEMVWSEEAEAVHQFTKEDVVGYGLHPKTVDPIVSKWANPSGHKRDFVMVGFNVGSFDRPFIKQLLPTLYERFSRRSVDLNSLIFAMSDSNSEFDILKTNAKRYAFEQMEGMFSGFRNRQHDAEYDAVMSLYCFEYLKSKIKNRFN